MKTAKLKKPATPKLDPATAAKALSDDMANLLARVARGEPLTVAQRKIIQKAAEDAPPAADAAEAGPNFAGSQSELARTLNVSRQVVGHHGRKPGAPRPRLDGRHDVSAWRRYLAAHGYAPTVAATASQGTAPRTAGIEALDYSNGVFDLTWRVGLALPRMLGDALESSGMKPSQSQLDLLAVTFYARTLAVADNLLAKHGFALASEPDPETGVLEMPAGITEAQARLASQA